MSKPALEGTSKELASLGVAKGATALNSECSLPAGIVEVVGVRAAEVSGGKAKAGSLDWAGATGAL